MSARHAGLIVVFLFSLKSFGAIEYIPVPAERLNFFLEIRAYAAEFASLRGLGLYSKKAFEDIMSTYIQQTLATDGDGPQSPLVVSGLLVNFRFNSPRFYKLAEEFEVWLQSELPIHLDQP